MIIEQVLRRHLLRALGHMKPSRADTNPVVLGPYLPCTWPKRRLQRYLSYLQLPTQHLCLGHLPHRLRWRNTAGGKPSPPCSGHNEWAREIVTAFQSHFGGTSTTRECAAASILSASTTYADV